jgi:[ribosomal protein S5]-alanine N-acetyltransferase
MIKPFEKYMGNNIYLRPLVDEDITERYLNWFKDEDVTYFLEVRSLTFKDVSDYIKRGIETGTYYMFAICLNENNLHIGNVKIGPIDSKHFTSGLPTFIGDKKYWGRNFGSEAIRLGTQIAFEKYNIRKMTGGMYSTNVFSMKEFLNGGWFVEAVLRGHYLLNDRTLDRICVACLNPVFFGPDYISSSKRIGRYYFESSGHDIVLEEIDSAIQKRLLDVAHQIFPMHENLSVYSQKSEIAEWDSLSNLNLFIALETEFGVEFEPNDYLNSASLFEVYNTIVSKLIVKDAK